MDALLVALFPGPGLVGDTSGHGEGDLALKDVANVLRRSLRKNVLASLANGTTPERRVGASITIVPEAQRFTTTDAVREADTATYTSKPAGGPRITVAEV